MDDIYNEFKKAYSMKWEKLGLSKDVAFDVWQKKSREVDRYMLELLINDSRGFEHCVREIVKSCNTNKDSGVLETIIDILNLKRNVVPFEDIMDIYHDLLFEKWHYLYDWITNVLDFELHPSSVKYLYEAMHQDIEFFKISPTVRRNFVYALWNFKTEEAEILKKSLLEDLQIELRDAAMHIHITDLGFYETKKHIELQNLCKSKSIEIKYDFPKEYDDVYKYYSFEPYKKFYENLKEPKVVLDHPDSIKWLKDFIGNNKIFVSLFEVEEKYLSFEDGSQFIDILDEYDFKALFICDNEFSYYITITKNNGVFLQGTAMDLFFKDKMYL